MAYQPAFEMAEVGYLDFETRSSTLDLRQVGAYRYATGAEAIVLSYAIGSDAEAETFAVYDFKSGPLSWARMPDAVKAHHARVMAGEAIWAAWNAGFDRAIWNYATLDFPEMLPAHIIDVMAQATAAGLPPDLAQASRLAHGAVKLKSGRDLIKLFCLPAAEGNPWSHQQEWQQFLDYACADVAALRDLFRRTLQLPAREWEEYFAMEHINQRGARVDLAMVRQAAALAREDRARSAEELYKITLGAVASVDEVVNMVQWLIRVLPADIVGDTLIKRPEEVDDDGNVTRPAKHHLTRKQVRQLIVDVTAALEREPTAGLRDALRLLEIRLYGGSKTPQKFLRIEQQVIDDVLFGQYVFGGAGQTGRASSRGAQVHNLARDTLPYEHQAIEALLAGADYSTMAALGDGAPVSRKLALLIRPAFVPAPGNLFVWSDWSQIEARILPWLAGNETRLDVFREVDADPSKPDLYTRAAAALSGIAISEVTPPIRQRGKVAELALGFGGGANALRSMATAYNMHLSLEEAAPIVTRWRENNQWCVAFWDDVYGAVIAAMRNPGMERPAGRVTYCYLPRYFGGSLICTLPSGRVLTYRQIKYENVPDLDDEDRVVGYSTHLRCARGYGRIKLWRGMFVENIVQATAADCLRGTLVRLVKAGYDVRLHTHDEILLEAPEGGALWIRNELRKFMVGGFPWSDGLPLASEETVAAYYTKDKSAYETTPGLAALSAAHCDASILP